MKPFSTSNFDTVQSAALRSVGAAFLKTRPKIVAPGIAIVLTVCVLAGIEGTRLLSIAAITTVMLGFFVGEALYARKVEVGERWLLPSLFITVTGISVACAVTGTWRSPFIPLVFAPVVVGFAAFGRGRASLGLFAYLIFLLGALAAVSRIDPWPEIPLPASAVLGLGATVISLLLLRAGVVGLTEAHVETGRALDRMRQAVVDESEMRARDLEAVGAKVAHDIKNPLASIKGLVQLMQKRPASDSDRERLGVVAAEVERIEATLNDYLSFSRPLDDLRLEEIDLNQLVVEVATALEGQAETREVGLHWSAESKMLVGDPGRLRDALLNLATNALDAAAPGGNVEIHGRVEHGSVLLEVRDTGPGLSADELARIGTPFYTTREGGTGLGVVLARTAVAQHGGELRYDSAPGRGTRVTVALPRMAS